MARNIEIKARVDDIDRLETLALSICDSGPQKIFQEDMFFHTESGRLKLREFGDGTGELIQYKRSDSIGPTESDYSIYPTNDPEVLKQVLSNSLGIRAVVRKKRDLYLVGQTRIHIDRVECLGIFIELEVVLNKHEDTNYGIAMAEDLMKKLNIKNRDLIQSAYVDLLQNNKLPK